MGICIYVYVYTTITPNTTTTTANNSIDEDDDILLIFQLFFSIFKHVLTILKGCS